LRLPVQPVEEAGQESLLAEPRPVLRGLRLFFSAPHHSSGPLHTCRAETRSQGIATRKQAVGLREGLRACRAETRSQGIATSTSAASGSPEAARILAEPRPVLRGLRGGDMPAVLTNPPALQSRDPFSGDCD